jgi:Cof subfamily protein (haloacid dehalogenase superfamily)
MNKFQGILICTDLDGTLLKKDKTISRENLDAIEYFKSEGGYFTFVTGRMPFFCHELYRAVRPNAPIGCINGGGLYDFETSRYLWTTTMPHSVLELVEYADRSIPGLGVQVNTFERIWFCRENEATEDFRRVTGVPRLNCTYEEIDEPIAKIVFCDRDEGHIEQLRALLFAHPRADEFDFIQSERTLYEILPRGIHKGAALPRLVEHLGTTMEKTIAVGDYDNDIGMLRDAHIGVAVANATSTAKAAADYITVSNEESAIARIISEIEQGILNI